MLIVKLIRHGESEFNRQGRIQGHTNSPLSATGKLQAELTGRWLRENSKIKRIYTSPLKRALQTAQIIAELTNSPLFVVEEFKEVGLGIWEGKSIEEVKENDPVNFKLWFTEPLKAKIKNAENLEAFKERVVRAFKNITEREPEGEIAIVTHGGVISAIIAHILELDMNHIWRIRLDNASVSEIRIEPEITRISLLNSTFHLNGIETKGISIWNTR